ncbi:MAG: glycosyltransferase family 2 protein [Bacteroidetes bacterium]|nr:glycosyltransferase family 2 protein [Bacteroidota bacterium]MDA1332931.1 glycosyltransferase family 2 protein [Bacteroidota bacterium]
MSLNEAENLTVLLPRVQMNLFDKVFAVDGNSDDGTINVYGNFGIPVFIQEKRGRGNAFQLAEKHAETDLIIFFSADGNENPDDLPVMLDYLNQGFDMVVAGRYLLKGSATDNSDDPIRLRKLAGIVGGWTIRILWGSRIKDPINGFRGFAVDALKRMALDAELHDIELQSTIRASKLGMKTKEFPTHELLRIAGQHKASAATFTLIKSLGKAILRELWTGNKFA